MDLKIGKELIKRKLILVGGSERRMIKWDMFMKGGIGGFWQFREIWVWVASESVKSRWERTYHTHRGPPPPSQPLSFISTLSLSLSLCTMHAFSHHCVLCTVHPFHTQNFFRLPMHVFHAPYHCSSFKYIK